MYTSFIKLVNTILVMYCIYRKTGFCFFKLWLNHNFHNILTNCTFWALSFIVISSLKIYMINISSWCDNIKSVNVLIGPIWDRDISLSWDQTKFGPKTTAKLEEVILFKSLRSITCNERRYIYVALIGNISSVLNITCYKTSTRYIIILTSW